VNNAEAIRKAFDAVLAAVSKLSGTDDEQKKAIEQLNVLAAEARKADNPAKHLAEVCARASNTCEGTLELIADVREFLYVKGAPGAAGRRSTWLRRILSRHCSTSCWAWRVGE